MSPKSKKVYASKSKSKSRTAKKGGGRFLSTPEQTDKPKFDGVVPSSADTVTSTPTPENKSNNMFGNFTMSNPFSGLFGSSKPQPQPQGQGQQPQGQGQQPQVGGKRLSKKSCKSKKHSKTNKNKCK